MGYCHVAHPVYLVAGDLKNAVVSNFSNFNVSIFSLVNDNDGVDRELMCYFSSKHTLIENVILQENVDLLQDGYQGDVLGESTPDVIVSEFVSSIYISISTIFFIFYFS